LISPTVGDESTRARLAPTNNQPRRGRAAQDAILAVVGLGYAHPQAAAAMARISAALGQEAETARSLGRA